MNKLNRYVEIAVQKDAAMANFMSAIDTERILLDGLVKMAETDQKIARLSAEVRKIRDELSALFVEDNEPLSDVFKWKKIVKPALVGDAEVQRHIETTYERAIQDRDKRLAALKERCAKDSVFTRLLCRRMVEAKYPYATKIVPAKAYLLAMLELERNGTE